jgi:flavin-dependent dehydrogenase
MMLNEAIHRGAEFLFGQAIRAHQSADGTVTGLTVRMPGGKEQRIDCEVLLDCSGQASWLANHGGITGPKYLGSYDKQIAIFSQVAGAERDPGGTREMDGDNTLIYQRKYHWSWFIPLDHEVTSIGVVVPSAYFLEKKEDKKDFLLREMRELHTDLAQRVQHATMTEDVHVIPNYSYQVRNFCGKGFVCIGDAHRFVDPIFSFGLTMSLLEAQKVAPVVKQYLEGKNRDAENPFADYEMFCEMGIDILEDMIDCFWEYPLAFAMFVYLRHKEAMLDMFAGRVYEDQPTNAIAMTDFRKMLGRTGMREESYRQNGFYSVPIGSRFHPERASIWEPNSPVDTTEAWLGPR